MNKSTLRTLLVFIVLSVTSAWSFSSLSSPSNQEQRSTISRRGCLEGLTAGIVGGSLLFPNPAFADVTNKVASSTALRNVKRAQKQLNDLLAPAQANDFTEVKAFLRTPPFVDVRKNCFILVRGGEDGPKADELQLAYKAFIVSVEKIDGTASLGMRGRKIPDLQMSEEYQVIESTMEEFVRVAQEATEIPVQYGE